MQQLKFQIGFLDELADFFKSPLQFLLTLELRFRVEDITHQSVILFVAGE
jgi:hypothetical protein